MKIITLGKNIIRTKTLLFIKSMPILRIKKTANVLTIESKKQKQLPI